MGGNPLTATADIVRAVTDWPPRYFIAFGGVAAGLLLGSHSAFAPALGLNDGPAWLRLALTTVSMSSFAIGSTKAWSHARGERRRRRETASREAASYERYHRFAKDERAVLAEFIRNDRKACTFVIGGSPSDGARTAHALAMQGILYQVSQNSNAFYSEITYAISDDAFAYLRSHPECLAISPP